MWTRRGIVAGIACLGGTSLTGAVPRATLSGPTTPAADAPPETTGWPSLMDSLPATIQAAVREGRYEGDLSAALRNAIETGRDFVVPPGIYPFAGGQVECRTPGQRIVGTGGVWRRLAERDGISVLVSARDVTLHGLRCDGRAPARERSHTNDMVKVTGDGCRLVDISVQGAWGSNLRIEGARGCRVVRPILTDAYQNNIIICEAPTRDIVIERPVCRRTITQNNIFVTASAASRHNGAVITGIVITDPLCSDAGDTGIELGYHCQDSRVVGGEVSGSVNPPLLQRDGRGNQWIGILVRNRLVASQHPDYDGVAVVPQWESPSWRSDTLFQDITVLGATRRSAFYWGQSDIRRIGCVADAQLATGASPIGSGDLKAGAVSDIVVEGGQIDGFAVGDNWNYDAAPYVRRGCSTKSVRIDRCTQTFNCYNVTPIDCAIVDNRGTGNQKGILLARAVLTPSTARPDIGLLYDGNDIATAQRDDPAVAWLLTRDSRFVRIDANRAVDAGPAQAGTFRLTTAAGQGSFTVTTKDGRPRIASSAMPPTAAINVAIENGRLVFHQRVRSPSPDWVRLSGPGIRPHGSA